MKADEAISLEEVPTELLELFLHNDVLDNVQRISFFGKILYFFETQSIIIVTTKDNLSLSDIYILGSFTIIIVDLNYINTDT